MARKTKQPRISKEPNPKKRPAIENWPLSNDSGQVFWSFSLIDCDGRWGFNSICKNEFHHLITSEFKSKEGISWSALKSNGGSHSVEKSKLIKAAQDRLADIHLDDIDELFSMRFTNKKRMWGIREGNVFKLLWWDPEHEIYPSLKKHT